MTAEHIPGARVETDRCVLRDWRPDEEQRVFDLYRRWEVAMWLGSTPHPMESLGEARRTIARWAELNASEPVARRWAVERKADGVVAGTVILVQLPDGDGEFEVGWHLHPDSWGNGYATEAARGALAWGFDQGLDEILAVVRPDNEPSVAVCRRLGMAALGRTRRYYDADLELFRTTTSPELVVRRHGRPPGEAPALLLLHGLTDSGSGWPDAIDRWGRDWSVVADDQRGHGCSPRFTPEQLSAHPGDVMVDDAVELLERLGEPAVVVGHSLGGAVALACAVRRPDLVRALVLEDPAPLGPDEQQQTPDRGKDFLAGVLESQATNDPAELLELRRRKNPTWSDAELAASGRGEQRTDNDFLANGEWKPSPLWPELFGQVSVPTLVISGDAPDGVCMTGEIEHGIDKLRNPHVSFVRVPGAAHCIRREQPVRFHEIVDGFLARRPV